MLTFYNEQHAQHRGRHEFFRGEQVPCFEKPERADSVLAELGRRGLGDRHAARRAADVAGTHPHAALPALPAHAWNEWLALDPANAQKDAFPSVWPVRTLRSDIEPENFAARWACIRWTAARR
jgi:hypothetical protein